MERRSNEKAMIADALLSLRMSLIPAYHEEMEDETAESEGVDSRSELAIALHGCFWLK